MSFSAWRSAIEPDLGAKPELKANYLNLLAEDRVPQMTSFQTSIGTQFVSSLSQNSADAELCLSSHLQLLGGVDSSWLGLLPSISQDHEKWRAVTYVSARHIEKYIDPNFDSTIRPLPPRVTVPQPVYSDSMGNPIKRLSIHRRLGDVLRELGQYDQSRAELAAALRLSLELRLNSETFSNYLSMARTELASDAIASAEQNIQLAKILLDLKPSERRAELLDLLQKEVAERAAEINVFD